MHVSVKFAIINAHTPNKCRVSAKVKIVMMNTFCELHELFVTTVSSVISQYSPFDPSASQTQPIDPGPQDPLLLHVIPYLSHITKRFAKISRVRYFLQ